MFKLTVVSLLAFVLKGQQTYECPSGPCTIEGNSTLIVIAHKSVTDLTVTCTEPNQCKANTPSSGLIVYSSANNTLIECSGESSCEEIELNFGITPNGGLGIDFEVTRSSITVECTGKQSCKTIVINNEGTVSNGLTIVTPTDTSINKATFLAGITTCGDSTQCILQCGSDIDTCKDSKCYDNCVCEGSACPIGYNERPTPEPTSPPVNSSSNGIEIPLPTPEPTPSPIDSRNITECTTNGCILTPGDYFDVICPASISSCIVSCDGISQCANGVIIEANSASVTLVCSSINACDKVVLTNTEPSSISVEISAEKAAENMIIIMENPASSISIDVSGKEGYSKGQLSCDATCNLVCSGEDSCKDATYECLTPSSKCGLDCDTADNQCPSIANFGDTSCTTPECTVTPDGNTRIVALNDVNTLTILCNTASAQCKKDASGLKIFSAAKKTILLCDTVDGCEDAMISVGPLTGTNVPKGFTPAEFARPNTESYTLTVDCDEESACKGIMIYTTGDTTAIVSGNGTDALQDTSSICDSCTSLEVYCREFDGCIGANILCTDAKDCTCIDAFEVDIGNDTAVLSTTETPRESCPLTSIYIPRQNGITGLSNANVIKTGISGGIKILIPMLIIGAVLVFCVGIIMVNYKKSYTKIGGGKSGINESKYMLKNENIYATYQVEMHQ